MRNKSFWLSTAALLLFVGSATASGPSWVIEGGELYLHERGKARRAVTLPDWQWADQPYACAPAVATGPRGEVLVTSNVLPVLWKIEPGTLAVSVHRLQLDADNDKDVGFSGLVYSARDGAYFAVSELHGTLWRIDPMLRRAQKVALAEPVRGACSLSMQAQQRTSRFSRLCLDNRSVNVAPDQRSAYVHAAGCSGDPFVMIGGNR